LKHSISDVNPLLKSFEASCFDGVYVTGDISPDYLDRVENARRNPKPVNEDAVRSQLNLNLAQVD
jgi:amidophosphoribosyltransferase